MVRRSVGETVQVVTAYGPLMPFQDYVVLESGYDWVKVRSNGGAIYVPQNLIGRAERPRYFERERSEEDNADYVQSY